MTFRDGGVIRSKSEHITEELFLTNLSFFLGMRRIFQRARTTIEMSLYIFEDDRVGSFFLNLLQEASSRGVRVQIVVDGYGSMSSYLKLRSHLQHTSAEIRIYSPMPWPFAHFYLLDYLRNGHFIPFLSHLNRRNHSKLIIVDSQEVVIGSRNLTDAILPWRETSVLVRKEVISKDVGYFFGWLWEKSFYFEKHLFDRPKKFQHPVGNIYFSYPRQARKQLLRNLMKKIENSQLQIQIVMPYFFPPLKLITALCQASKRGVSVEIILPSRTDIYLFPRMSRFLYGTLLKFRIKIFEYHEVMIHAKQVRIDDWILVGSSNLNSRSLFHDLEVDYVLSEVSCIEALVKQFEIDKKRSKRVVENEFSESPMSWLVSRLISLIFGGSI